MAHKTKLTLNDFEKMMSEVADKMKQQQDEIKKLKKEIKERNESYRQLASHHNLKCTCLNIY